jgi:nitrate/TMAO reductase-like tetraheme cytochrome c subunit
VRILTTVVAVAAAGVVVVALAGGPGEKAPLIETSGDADPALFETAAGCGTCHRAIYLEWQESMHAQAITDPYARDLAKGWTKTECLPCHRPQPLHENGIGERPLTRTTRNLDGIDCLSCHYVRGGVAAPHADAEGPCNPIYTPAHATVALCAGCHNQHWTVDEWNASKYSKEGPDYRSCNDCHMPLVREPVVTGGKPRDRRRHTWPGAHSLAEHRKAVTFDVALVDGEIVASTTNSGAGHKIPTDARHRSYNVLLWFEDEAGNPVAGPIEIAEYRLYYRQMFHDPESTQVEPDATATARYAVPEGLTKGRAIARIFYCLTPDIAGVLKTRGKAPAAMLVAETTIEIESGRPK